VRRRGFGLRGPQRPDNGARPTAPSRPQADTIPPAADARRRFRTMRIYANTVGPPWEAVNVVGDERAGRDHAEAVLVEMQSFRLEGDYYALTVGADHSGGIYWSCESWWVGDSPRRPREGYWEVRAASLTRPDLASRAWSAMSQGWVAVHDDAQLVVFLRLGGNALVEKCVADSRLASVVCHHECVHDGSEEAGLRGFAAVSDLPDAAATDRAPSRKLRMQVLARDRYRCVICGRRATDHIDVELHVHHLIPWQLSGPTALDDLVTLCGSRAGLPGPIDHWDLSNIEFDADVSRYRGLVAGLDPRPRTLPSLWGHQDRLAKRYRRTSGSDGAERLTRAMKSSNKLYIRWNSDQLSALLGHD
jgi:hypothetical protein